MLLLSFRIDEGLGPTVAIAPLQGAQAQLLAFTILSHQFQKGPGKFNWIQDPKMPIQMEREAMMSIGENDLSGHLTQCKIQLPIYRADSGQGVKIESEQA